MAEDEADQAAENGNGEETSPGAVVGAIALVAVTLFLGYLLVNALYPDQLAVDQDPDFIDSIFDNKLVVLAARLVLFSIAIVLAVGGLFVIVSTFVRMGSRDWLKRAGPFEVSERAAAELEAQFEFWRDTALTQQEQISELTQRLQASDELIEILFEEEEPAEKQG